ncbi:MAG: hypothetical protein B9S33_08210 [Pedosphaera sp. Tous-C6FEB]|nr:MAG: hypothetical protein B9S33_08210 [Pedosphaera sp. Tous-C6FEB]
MLDSIKMSSAGPTGATSENVDPSAATPETLALSLKSVLDRLPATLKPLVSRAPGADERVTVATARVLPQLSTGAVRITFDELRQGAPADLFAAGGDQGGAMVDLPLPEILRAAGPALLKRKSSAKAEPAGGMVFPGIKPATAPPPAPAPAPVLPAAPAAPPAPAALETFSVKPTLQPSFTPPPAASAPPTFAPAPVSEGTTFFHPAAPASAHAPAESKSGRVSIILSTLSAGWPESIRQEVSKLGQATVEFPRDELGNAMKTGKVVFTWGQLCSWMSPSAGPSPLDATPLQLPLRLLVQPFMANMRAGDAAKRPAANEGRTESFVNRAPTPELIVPPPAPPPVDTKLGEALGRPEKATWTPVEIISAVRQLAGVSGAMLSLQEGHLAAADLTATLPPELLAYGLPKIISATAEQARQMKLGEPTMVSLTADGHQWAIFKLEKIIFTVMSRKGEPLPLPQLQTIATEIGRQRK